ncbi:MAG TPA: hypothetical protein VF432_13840 [Thermoanaerobaculia bacterium]
MKTLTLIAALLLSLPIAASDAPPISDIAGVRLGMSRDEVRSGLATTARLEREERRRHEVWTLAGDARFASLIVGYTKEWKVRFVTAVAKPDGAAVGYGDVLDLTAANHKAAGKTHTYTWVTGTPPYSIIAIGGPSRLEYLSLEDEH